MSRATRPSKPSSVEDEIANLRSVELLTMIGNMASDLHYTHHIPKMSYGDIQARSIKQMEMDRRYNGKAKGDRRTRRHVAK